MKNRSLLLLITFLFSTLTASSQSWLWGEQGNAGLKADGGGRCIATDKTGNVYETGGYAAPITFGTYTLAEPTVEEGFLVKYDQNGNLLWAEQSNTVGDYTIGFAVAADDSDNAYVSGTSDGAAIFGTDTLPQADDLFIVKYSPNGSVVWAKGLNSSVISIGGGYAIATDNFGYEYVTGTGAFLLKYNRNGNLKWIIPQTINNNTNISGQNTGHSVATDIFGNVYMAGEFQDSLNFGKYHLYSPTLGVYIAKFDSNGKVLWAQQSSNTTANVNFFNSTTNLGYTVATDRLGAVYLTSTFSQDSITFGSYTFITSSPSNNDFYILKFNPTGTIAWGMEAVPLNGGTFGAWGSYSICTDSFNHLYISGACAQTLNSGKSSFALANDTVSIADTIMFDAPSFLLKLDSSGQILCVSTLPGGGLYPNSVVSDITGNFIYLGGSFTNNLDFGKDSLKNNTGGPDPYVARWQSCNECNLTVTIAPQLVSVCAGDSITLKASGGTNYIWSPASSLSSSNGDSVIASPLIQTTYTITGTNSQGCIGSASDVVTILPAPDKPTLSQHDSILITNATQGIQWSRNDTVIPGATTQNYTITIAGWYKVVVVNPANGCSATSDSMYFSPTGVNQLTVNSGQVTVYPNPTGGEVFVNINSSAAEVNDWNLQVTDVLGRIVFTMSPLNPPPMKSEYMPGTFDIDLSNLSSGVYFISVGTKTGRVVVPVVKE